MKKLMTIILGILFVMTLSLAHAEWEDVVVGREAYVTFRSFCKFYGFSKPPKGSTDKFEISGKYGRMRFKADSRECYINGVRYWLGSCVILASSGELLLPKVDLIKTINPILRPETVSRKIVKGVIIDPGHGGSDNGAVGRNGLMEKNLALNTALRLGKILSKKGIKTVFTRTSDSFPSLVQRAQYTQRYSNYIFVSVHYNQGSSTSKGVETFCLTPRFAASTADEGNLRNRDNYVQPGNVNDEYNILLASCIHTEIIKLHPQDSDRGLKRARFAVLRRALTPSVLVEGGFVSNTHGDLRLLASPTYREALAQRIAQGVMAYITLMNGEVQESPEASFIDSLFRNTSSKPNESKPQPKPVVPTSTPRSSAPATNPPRSTTSPTNTSKPTIPNSTTKPPSQEGASGSAQPRDPVRRAIPVLDTN